MSFESIPENGFCVMHLRLAGHPLDPDAVGTPTPEGWEAAERFAAEHAVTWWDHNPVFATRESAEEYAWLAPVETETVAVEISPVAMREEDGWFDSFRSSHWFRAVDGNA